MCPCVLQITTLDYKWWVKHDVRRDVSLVFLYKVLLSLLFGFSLFQKSKIQLCLTLNCFVTDPVLALGQVMVVWCVRVLPGWRTYRSTDILATLHSSSPAWSPSSARPLPQVRGVMLLAILFLLLLPLSPILLSPLHKLSGEKEMKSKFSSASPADKFSELLLCLNSSCVI